VGLPVKGNFDFFPSGVGDWQADLAHWGVFDGSLEGDLALSPCYIAGLVCDRPAGGLRFSDYPLDLVQRQTLALFAARREGPDDFGRSVGGGGQIEAGIRDEQTLKVFDSG
jgi:hypothetical protein